MEELDCVKMTSPLPFEPDNDELLTMQRKPMAKTNCNLHLPEGISMSEWRNRLALAPEEVVQRTFDATTQMVTNVECKNRDIPQRHFKSRFPFLREKRINDTFHSDTFFPSITSNQGHTCSQIFLGKNTDLMYVQPMKKESHSYIALQDFSRTVGIPNTIKTDNAKTETGERWTNWCRKYQHKVHGATFPMAEHIRTWNW